LAQVVANALARNAEQATSMASWPTVSSALY